MRPRHYILNENGDPVPANALEYIAWQAENHEAYIVARSTLADTPQSVYVSTVFLGLDHQFYGDGPPILFETMVFVDEKESGQWRCTTREEALQLHANAVDMMLEKIKEGTVNEAEIKDTLKLVEHAVDQVEDWTVVEQNENMRAYRGQANGWTFNVVDFDISDQGFPEGTRGYDGASGKGSTVMRLPREVAEKAVRLAYAKVQGV